MPVYPPGSWLRPESDDASGQVAAGRFAVPFEGGRFDRHLHDDDEIWFVSNGKASIVVDGREQYVQAGDIVLHPAGTVHDVVAVYEPLAGFFSETGHPTGGRSGHRHADPADADGHDVPGLPLPADFPTRGATA
jgi:mannose-6-phosphate isomerase-like protein (cupin superfamily)